MLKTLKVKNIALIDDIEVDFENGLNILSGETGAGKSILIESVYLILGSKISKEMIRKGKDYIYVELIFSNLNESIINLIKSEGININNEVVLSRKILDNKSYNYIDGEIVPLKTLKLISNSLINIHGQAEQLELTNEKNHLNYVDLFGDTSYKNKLLDLNKLFFKYKNEEKELISLIESKNTSKNDIELLEYEVNELKNSNIILGEDNELEKKYDLIKDSIKINDIVKYISSSIYNDNGTSNNISNCIKKINSINTSDSNIDLLKNNLLEIEELLNNNQKICLDILDDISTNINDEKEILDRLNTLNFLKSKYNTDLEGLINLLDIKTKQLDTLKDINVFIINKEKNVKDCYNKYMNLACEISKKRKNICNDFEKKVNNELLSLGFNKCEFKIEINTRNEANENGLDDIVFLISTNLGEDLKPISKVASGGEISRIMLAIKVVLGSNNNINTLIFDEIDTGISGAVAEMVGRKLSLLSNNCQIICITHLAQIASFGDTNYLIYKQTDNNSTYTKIKKLDNDAKIDEISRILGGVNINNSIKNNAINLINDAISFKNKEK